MRTRFDEQLEQLHVELITMGALCEEAITLALKPFLIGIAAWYLLCWKKTVKLTEKKEILRLCVCVCCFSSSPLRET